jgi:hypothetical protein
MPLRRIFIPGALAVAAVACAAATTANGPASKYPRRPANCKLTVYHDTAINPVLIDDIGTAEVGCYLDEGVVTCFNRLKAEACAMGGDILYDVPRKPLRPRDQAMVFRGRVAHTRPRPEKAQSADAGEMPPPATPEESAGPVIPLGAPEPPASGPADAGAVD